MSAPHEDHEEIAVLFAYESGGRIGVCRELPDDGIVILRQGETLESRRPASGFYEAVLVRERLRHEPASSCRLAVWSGRAA